MKEFWEQNNKSEINLNCLFEKCGLEFDNYLKLSQHIRRTHNITTKQYYDKFLKKNNENICICGNEIQFLGLNKGYNKYCSSKCSATNNSVKEKRKKTNIEKYGVENVFQNEKIKDKIQKTNIEKYGVENVFQNEEIKEKIKQTNIEKYGVENPNKNKKIREKIKQTNIEKYGTETPSKNKKIRDKIQKTNIEKYGYKTPLENKEILSKVKQTNIEKYSVENIFQTENVKNKIRKNNYNKFIKKLNILSEYLNVKLLDEEYKNKSFDHKWKCTKCNYIFIQKWDYIQQGYKCPNCYHRNFKYSIKEKEISDYLKSLNLIINENDRNIISPYELDIYIPSKNIAIEFNGLYWHNDIFKDKFYHLNKTELCENKNIRLIHIFEDEWIYNKNIVKNRLKQILDFNNNLIKIHARKCQIKEINSKDKNKFLNVYHLQGEDKSVIKLGAFYNEELISVMTFSHGSISRKKLNFEDLWELSRFCSNSNYHIPGIASKLLTYFKRNFQWYKIFSYADRRWSQGELYYKLGFKLDSVTKPNYSYVKNNTRIHRFSLRKKYNEPKDIPEWVLRQKEGYYRIWDCGHYKFKLTNH